MAVYNKSGNILPRVYGKSGAELAYAYDKSGNVIHISDTPIPDYSNYSYVEKWASKNISNTQGFGIYDDKVFWISKSGDATVDSKCYVFNLSDGSQALASAYITAYTGHGNSISIDFPKMYSATAYSGGKVHISTFSNDFLTNTLDKTLVLPTTTANEQIYGCDACLDEDDKTILWSIHHTSGTSDRDTPWRIRKWDLTTLANNGDGTYTPLLLEDVSLVQPANSFYFQGCAMHDGILWFANGYSGSSTIAYVFGVNPNTGEYLYSINCETTAEPEGVAWVADAEAVGGYALYVGFQGMALRKYTFDAVS